MNQITSRQAEIEELKRSQVILSAFFSLLYFLLFLIVGHRDASEVYSQISVIGRMLIVESGFTNVTIHGLTVS